MEAPLRADSGSRESPWPVGARVACGLLSVAAAIGTFWLGLGALLTFGWPLGCAGATGWAQVGTEMAIGLIFGIVIGLAVAVAVSCGRICSSGRGLHARGWLVIVALTALGVVGAVGVDSAQQVGDPVPPRYECSLNLN